MKRKDAAPGEEARGEPSRGHAEAFRLPQAAQTWVYLSVSLMESERGGHSRDSPRPAPELGPLFRREVIIFGVDRVACLCLSAACWLMCSQTSLIPL